MDQILFDEKGRFIGLHNGERVNRNQYDRPSSIENNVLMTSKNLSFLKESENIKSQDSEYWSLYENNKPLKPLVYSNGKSQENIVREVIDLIKSGKKTILIHGVCGTGKSSIALNIARVIGKTSIIVPIKNLQKQYEEDYTNKKFVLKNGKKMKIALITGRDNHDSIIFPGVSCADPYLPDTILLTEKNRDKIQRFYNQNPFISSNSIPEIRKIKRISIAPSNPYWSPIRPAEFELSQLSDAKKKRYKGVLGKEYIFYHRKEGCSYYDQFQAYIDADVIIFNSAKYNIELAIGRKPETEVEIIDEADAFLDSFSKEDTLNLTHLSSSLQRVIPDSSEAQEQHDKVGSLLVAEIKNKLALGIDENQIFPLKETSLGKMLKAIFNSKALQAEVSLDEQNYTNKAIEVALVFDDLFDDAFVTFRRQDNDLYATLVTTNVAKRFTELQSKTKALVLMSGTLHSQEVLKNLFGLKDFSIVEAETKTPGKIEISETGLEMSCDYKNLKSSESKRGDYLKALSECLEKAKRPALVHVNSYEDLPSEQELLSYSFKSLISKEKLKSLQSEYKNGELVEDFKNKKSSVLFATNCSRGVDFPGETCNSVIFTKYPNPNVREIFWRILQKTHPQHYWSFYRDKANREFLQRIYRALRSKDDHVYLLSPDSRVIDAAKKII